jgi:two-component sensor histidine kinase
VPQARPAACQVCDPAREADHRIANHLGMLGGLVRLKAIELASSLPEASRSAMQLALDGIISQIQAVSRLHRSLATRLPGAGIDLSEHLHDVCLPFMTGLSGAIVITEDFSPGCVVSDDQVLPLTQIVSEVVTNAIKYSHAKGEPGRVHVACHKLQDGQLEIQITDDGRGFPDHVDPHTAGGLGFRLIRALAAQLEATFAFESSNGGLCFWLRLSASPPRTD